VICGHATSILIHDDKSFFRDFQHFSNEFRIKSFCIFSGMILAMGSLPSTKSNKMDSGPVAFTLTLKVLHGV